MIGTSEIKVRYEKVSELIKCLNKYKKALEKMKKSIIAIREVYKEGKGKTMESLVKESDILIKYIDGLEQDVSDLMAILVKYVTETTAIIKPDHRDAVMKIDRNNILQKKNSIINTCSQIPKIHSDVTVPYFDDWILWGEDEEERELELARRARNDDKLDSIKYHIRSVEKEITSLIDKVNGVYNGVKYYEDKDQQFAWEAKKLVKDKPTPVETHDDGKSKIGEQVIHFGEGFLDSIVDLVKGLADSTVGIVKYDASFVTYLYGEISGNEIPKWADDYCYNTSVETNEKIKAVLNDPMIVVDSIKNGIQDTYEEKGVAYCGGYAVGFIGTTVAGTKGMDKLAKLGKGGKAARTLEELGYVDDAMVTLGDDLATVAGEVKTATKVADTAEDLTKVAGKVKKVTKADELSEAAKTLAEGGEAAGKGGVVEEVVSKSGTDASIKNIDEFIGGNKSFDDVLDDYAKVYADKINSNQAWSWDDMIPGGEKLTKKQRSIIKQQAIDNGLIPDIKVTKVDGMRYGFADFESAGVVKETQYLPENMWKMSDVEQFKWLDEQIGGTVEGYTWHHTEILGKMQLVPTGIHNITTHNGGRTAGMWADAPR